MTLVQTYRGAACAAFALTSATAWSQTTTASQGSVAKRSAVVTMKQDLANRSPDIHWPEGFDPSQADLFSHNQLRIAAPCEHVWSHIVDATKWPEWYPNSKEVRITSGGNVLSAGTVFRWTTFGLPLESRVNTKPNAPTIERVMATDRAVQNPGEQLCLRCQICPRDRDNADAASPGTAPRSGFHWSDGIPTVRIASNASQFDIDPPRLAPVPNH